MFYFLFFCFFFFRFFFVIKPQSPSTHRILQPQPPFFYFSPHPPASGLALCYFQLIRPMNQRKVFTDITLSTQRPLKHSAGINVFVFRLIIISKIQDTMLRINLPLFANSWTWYELTVSIQVSKHSSCIFTSGVHLDTSP